MSLDDGMKPRQVTAAGAVSIGKDLVALLRDAALFLLGALLIVFPAKFNAMLESAGFAEGSIVGFKWKASLLKSDSALKEAQDTISDLQSKNDELVAALGEAKGHSSDATLEARINELEGDNRRLKNATQAVQQSVSQSIEANAPLVGRVPRAKSDFIVGLQTLGVTNETRTDLNNKLQAAGFGLDPITYSYDAGQRPSWFALRSTVFYYSSSARAMAREVANLMRSATGQEFAVQQGAGLGVDPDQRDVTLFVHYIKKS